MSQTIFTNQEPVDGTLREEAAVYFFFARLFREAPSAEFLREIGRSDPVEDAGWLRQAEKIAVDYARLFMVPGEGAVRPYESVYCDTLTIDSSTACSPYFEPEPQRGSLTGFLQGPSAIAVRKSYQRAGFDLDSEAHELPDHLAIELEFLGRLLERGDMTQANTFFAEHLGRWVFRCLDEIVQKTGSGFYQTVAGALASFLHEGHKNS